MDLIPEAAPPAALAGLSFSQTFGAGLIGSWIAICLFGLSLAQAYHYFLNYPKDNILTKALVWFLIVLNAVHVIATCHVVYHYVILSAFDLIALDENVWSFPTSIGTQVIASVLVLLYWTKLCCQLSNKKMRWCLAVLLGSTILLYFGFSIEVVVRISKLMILSDFGIFLHSSIMPMVGLQFAADILISAALCYVLNANRTAFKHTSNMISRMMLFTINRGLVTAVIAAAVLIAFLVAPHAMWFIGLVFSVSGLYTNSLLATLNSRKSISGAAAVPTAAWSVPLTKVTLDSESPQLTSHESRDKDGSAFIEFKPEVYTSRMGVSHQSGPRPPLLVTPTSALPPRDEPRLAINKPAEERRGIRCRAQRSPAPHALSLDL